jgi:hypothetical protein
MGALIDFFARNRARIGGALSTIYVAISQIDPQLLAAHPKISGYAAIAIGLILGSGAFKSDSYQRDIQGKP